MTNGGGRFRAKLVMTDCLRFDSRQRNHNRSNGGSAFVVFGESTLRIANFASVCLKAIH